MQAAITSIMCRCHSSALILYKMEQTKFIDVPLMLCWLSVEAHFQNRTVTMSLFLLPMEAAIVLIMDNSKQIASQLTYKTKNHWQSIRTHFQNGAATVSLSHVVYKRCQYVDYR